MSRPQRNRRLSRRVWSPEHDGHHVRPVKRLFTPEIKRMLKDWLVRRRENPYPSRDEKKRLALETGLTYTQICNWFANWRRKLKNSENERIKNSWGALIKNYNTNARGNVEQFSISSEDSIWEEELEDELTIENDKNKILPRRKKLLNKKIQPLRRKVKASYDRYYSNKPKYYSETIKMEHSNYLLDNNDNHVNLTAQCLQVSSSTTTDTKKQTKDDLSTNFMNTTTGQENKTKYKQKIMEKYLRDTYSQNQNSGNTSSDVETAATTICAAELSKKWLESATKFTPTKNNYYVEWNNPSKQFKHGRSVTSSGINNSEHNNSVYTGIHNKDDVADVSYSPELSIHHKDELDAAEALANLAFNCRQRMLDTHSSSIQSTVSVISS